MCELTQVLVFIESVLFKRVCVCVGGGGGGGIVNEMIHDID